MENSKKQLIDEEAEKVAGGHNPSSNQNKPNGIKTGAPNGTGGIKTAWTIRRTTSRTLWTKPVPEISEDKVLFPCPRTWQQTRI